MLSKEQAEAISTDLINQQRSSQLNAKYVRILILYAFYGFPALRALPPDKRRQIIRQARSMAIRHWQTRLAFFVWLTLVVAMVFLLPSGSWQGLAIFAGAVPVTSSVRLN